MEKTNKLQQLEETKAQLESWFQTHQESHPFWMENKEQYWEVVAELDEIYSSQHVEITE